MYLHLSLPIQMMMKNKLIVVSFEIHKFGGIWQDPCQIEGMVQYHPHDHFFKA
jgi:hypothetical protein